MPTTGKNAVSFGPLQALDNILQNTQRFGSITPPSWLLASAFESKSCWQEITYLKSNILLWWLSFQTNPCPALFHHTATEVFELLQEAGKVKTAYFGRRKAQINKNSNTKVKNPAKKRRPYLHQPASGLTEHQNNRIEQQKKILVRAGSLKRPSRLKRKKILVARD